MGFNWKFMCIYVVFASFGADCTKVNFTDVPSDIANNIFLYLIKGPTITDNVKLALVDGLSLSDYDFFNSTRETTFYFHGWGENPNRESVVTIANAFLQRNITNLVIFDYSVLVKADNDAQYLESFVNASYIGTAIGQFLQQYRSVQSLKLSHLLSHSLGSQIMSKTARTYGTGLLPWLTALDPAGPLFNIPGVEHLQESDAAFVDVVHTDGGFYGDYRKIGTVDFYPNRGTRVQPHCEDETLGFCSHHMSWRLYAESILNSTSLPGRKCVRTDLCHWDLSFCICRIFAGEFTYVGYNINKRKEGDFYMTTNSQSPFGRGKAGMDFL